MRPAVRAPPGEDVALRSGLLGRTAGLVQAVDDVSFDVCKGETRGIVGERGCGKSTTLRLLMGLPPATSGENASGPQRGGQIAVANPQRQVGRMQATLIAIPTGS